MRHIHMHIFSDTFSPVCVINTCIIDQKRERCPTKATLHVGLTVLEVCEKVHIPLP